MPWYSKTNTYIVPFTGYVEIHASTKEKADKIFEEQVFGREGFPCVYSITYDDIQETQK